MSSRSAPPLLTRCSYSLSAFRAFAPLFSLSLRCPSAAEWGCKSVAPLPGETKKVARSEQSLGNRSQCGWDVLPLLNAASHSDFGLRSVMGGLEGRECSEAIVIVRLPSFSRMLLKLTRTPLAQGTQRCAISLRFQPSRMLCSSEGEPIRCWHLCGWSSHWGSVCLSFTHLELMQVTVLRPLSCWSAILDLLAHLAAAVDTHARSRLSTVPAQQLPSDAPSSCRRKKWIRHRLESVCRSLL